MSQKANIGQDGKQATLDASALTANRTITLPDAAGNAVIDSAAQTLTSKRIQFRVAQASSPSTLTPDVSVEDQVEVLALANALTIAAPIGTPTYGDALVIKIKDSGTARALTWNSVFRAIGCNLPTTTTVSKWTIVVARYNPDDVKWDVILVVLEGDAMSTAANAITLTNKRITRRSGTTSAPGATPSLNTDNYDVYNFTGLAVAITSMTTNLTGTPVTGDKLLLGFKDNGTARAITWGASFKSSGVATLLATTVISKQHWVELMWDGSAWVCLAVDATGY